MLQKFYDRAFVFLKLVEQEYASLGQSCSEWESLHLRIKSDRDFSLYHFKTAYRLYLDKFLQGGTTLIQ